MCTEERYTHLPNVVDIVIEKIGLSGKLIKSGSLYTGICPVCGKCGFDIHATLGTYSCSSCSIGRNGSSLLDLLVEIPAINVKDECAAWFWVSRQMIQECKKGRRLANIEAWALPGEI